MVEGCEHFGFALKPREALRIASNGGGQYLDRHCPFQVAVGRTIHLSHAAGANGGGDFIGAETRAGDKRQG